MAAASEWQRIAELGRALGTGRGGGVVVGIGDDAAVLRPRPGRDLLATQDALVEDVHFRRRWTAPADLAYKALAVSVSDIAAMGGRPRWALWTLALPADLEPAWIAAFAAGAGDAARRLGLRLVGGDSVRSSAGIVVDGVVLGEAARGRIVGRAGARPGDVLFVTGRIGGARAGLDLLETPTLAASLSPRLVARAHARLLRPTPRVAAGRRLASVARAAVDLSDGLAGAVEALRRAGAPGVILDAARLPLDPAARAVAHRLGVDPALYALVGGEDYELLFAVGPRRLQALTRPACGLTAVGRVTAETGAWLETSSGERLPLPAGYDAFAPAVPAQTTLPAATTASIAPGPRR